MKKQNHIKKAILSFTFITAIFLLTSFIHNNNPSSFKIVDEKIINTKFEEKSRKIDSTFLVKASEINLKEIQLGQLAYQKGKSYHVRQLGELIKIGHSQS